MLLPFGSVFAIKLVAFICFYGLPIYILDPDWDRINFDPDLDPSCLTVLWLISNLLIGQPFSMISNRAWGYHHYGTHHCDFRLWALKRTVSMRRFFWAPLLPPPPPFFFFFFFLFFPNIMIAYFCHTCGSCSYALKYFCNVELMALYAFLAGNDVTSLNVTPIWLQLGRKWCDVTPVNGQ